MKVFSILKTLLITGIVMLSLDAVYLSAMKNAFENQIAAIQRVAMQFRIWGAIFCYIFLIGGLYYFILKQRRPIMDAFLLGIFVYGVYETTNYAFLKQWKWEIVVADTLWGGILFALTTGIVYWALDNIV